MEVEGQRSVVNDAKVACTDLECVQTACSSDTRSERCQSELAALKVLVVQAEQWGQKSE